MSIRAVIFDFDGTIADTNQLVIDSWQHTYTTINGEPYPEEKIVRTFGEPLRASMIKAFPNHDTDEVIQVYRDFQMEETDNPEYELRLFPGMRKLLIELKEKGYKVGMVTSRTRDTCLRGMRRLDIEKYMDAIVTCNDTNKHKPDPEPARICLRELNAEPQEAVMIGDTMYDIKCAHNAGMKAVLVDWAVAIIDEDLSGPDKPEYIIEKAEDLFEVI